MDTHNESNSFVDFSASVLDVTGRRADRLQRIGQSLLRRSAPGDPLQPQCAVGPEREALAQAYQAASDGMGGGYNITGAS